MFASQETRDALTLQTETLGKSACDLREALVAAKMSFVAGLVRGAEEILLFAYTMLRDAEETDL